MKLRRTLLLSFLITLIVWVLFTWPLPLYLFTGIPSGAKNVEKHHVRTMIAGDHLQLLYHFWLAGDMACGRTPLFHDVYQFNAGDDKERYLPSWLPASWQKPGMYWIHTLYNWSWAITSESAALLMPKFLLIGFPKTGISPSLIHLLLFLML